MFEGYGIVYKLGKKKGYLATGLFDTPEEAWADYGDDNRSVASCVWIKAEVIPKIKQAKVVSTVDHPVLDKYEFVTIKQPNGLFSLTIYSKGCPTPLLDSAFDSEIEAEYCMNRFISEMLTKHYKGEG